MPFRSSVVINEILPCPRNLRKHRASPSLRMLQNPSSGVLASLKASTYQPRTPRSFAHCGLVGRAFSASSRSHPGHPIMPARPTGDPQLREFATVSAERGTRGSQLVQRCAAVAKQIVVAIQGFVASLRRLNLHDGQLFLVTRRPMLNDPFGGDDFTLTDVGQPLFAPTGFTADAIASHGKHSIFEAPNRHRIRAVRQD